MAEVELTIAGRAYRVACRAGEEDNLRAAAALVDGKSKEALAGLGTLSESRQLLFASLLLADQIIDGRAIELPSGPDPELAERAMKIADQIIDGRAIELPSGPDPELADRAAKIADRLESLADALETADRSA